jgi:hypothetical protein
VKMGSTKSSHKRQRATNATRNPPAHGVVSSQFDTDRDQEFPQSGVRIRTMRQKGFRRGDIRGFIVIIPGGIAHASEKESSYDHEYQKRR